MVLIWKKKMAPFLGLFFNFLYISQFLWTRERSILLSLLCLVSECVEEPPEADWHLSLFSDGKVFDRHQRLNSHPHLPKRTGLSKQTRVPFKQSWCVWNKYIPPHSHAAVCLNLLLTRPAWSKKMRDITVSSAYLWCGRWRPPEGNGSSWMKLAHGMGTPTIWQLKRRLMQDSWCLTSSPPTIHLDICFHLFSPVRRPTGGGGFLLACAEGLNTELLPTTFCALWKSWRITASCWSLCFFLLDWKPPQAWRSDSSHHPSPTSSFLLLVRTFCYKLSNSFTPIFIPWRQWTRSKPKAGR